MYTRHSADPAVTGQPYQAHGASASVVSGPAGPRQWSDDRNRARIRIPASGIPNTFGVPQKATARILTETARRYRQLRRPRSVDSVTGMPGTMCSSRGRGLQSRRYRTRQCRRCDSVGPVCHSFAFQPAARPLKPGGRKGDSVNGHSCRFDAYRGRVPPSVRFRGASARLRRCPR